MAGLTDGPLGTGDPIDAGTIEWESFKFRELEENELFWFQNTINEQNGPCRKRDENTAFVLKDRTIVEVKSDTTVYQKEY